jgi:hypothetical protein
VYDERDELRMRHSRGAFKLETDRAGHDWFEHDLTHSFAAWLSSNTYAKKYFQSPQFLSSTFDSFLGYLKKDFDSFCSKHPLNENGVVALYGVGSLYGVVKVKEVVEQIAASVPGKLVVFFPGVYENNNYRLLNGYDGWNYHAVPLTAAQE